MAPPTNYTGQTVNSSNYTGQTINQSNYEPGEFDKVGGYIILQDGSSYLLYQDGSSKIVLQ